MASAAIITNNPQIFNQMYFWDLAFSKKPNFFVAVLNCLCIFVYWKFHI